MLMTKTVQKRVARSIRQKRDEIASLREDLENLTDYLDGLEARVRDKGKTRLTHEEVKRRYGVR